MEVAAEYEREQRCAALIRSRLPARIDELLLTELACCFDYRLCELLCDVSARAARSDGAGAWRCAHRALSSSCRLAAEALEGLSARLAARSGIAWGAGRLSVGQRRLGLGGSRGGVFSAQCDTRRSCVAAEASHRVDRPSVFAPNLVSQR